jgi:hypothetical protein
MSDNGETQSGSGSPKAPPGRVFSRTFWGTILVMVGVTIGLLVTGMIRSSNDITMPESAKPAQDSDAQPNQAPATYDVEPLILQDMFTQAAESAATDVFANIDKELDAIYSPVYAGITSYADFHYSVMGEYTELTKAALGTMSANIETRLFKGFRERLEQAATKMDDEFEAAFQRHLEGLLEPEIPAGMEMIPLGRRTQIAIDDVIARLKVTVPVATVAATVGSVATIKAISKVWATKIATKVAMKAAAKGVAKGTGVLGGAGVGALAGSWLGPIGAGVGGVIGGVGTWLFVDAVVINIDEYFNRDEFEADLKQMVDENRAAVRSQLLLELDRKQEDIGDFTFREMHEKEGRPAAIK